MSAEHNLALDASRPPASATDTSVAGRRLLALDTLSHLIEHGLRDPSLNSLFAELLMSLAGQFSVGSAAAIIVSPEGDDRECSVISFGDIGDQGLLNDLRISDTTAARFLADNGVARLSDICGDGPDDELVTILSKLGITIVCPLVSEQTFYGLVGLGARVTDKAYQLDDLALLKTLVNTVTPLAANVFLFQRLALLNIRHLEILNSVKQAVYVFDHCFILKKMNTAASAMLQKLKIRGDSCADMIGMEIDRVFPRDLCPGWESAVTQFALSGSSTKHDRVVLVSANSERFYNVCMSNVAGRSVASPDLVITFEDVTEQRQNERRLYDLTVFADKGQMASSIAHELNNYLAILSAQASMAHCDFSGGKTPAGLDRLERLIEDILKMRRYTGGLVDFGKLNSVRTMTNLSSIVQEILPFLRVQKKFAHIELRSQIDQDLPQVFLDPDRMTQVFLNLLNNAADAIEEAKRIDGFIEVQAKREAGTVVITVRDNGIGMPEEVRARLFQNNFTTKEQGHGYGLMTCGQILREHHATIDIQSAPNEGSTFRISLPLSLNGEEASVTAR